MSRTASHRAAVLTAVGAALVFLSLAYSAVSLYDMIRQKEMLKEKISELETRVVEMQKLLDEKALALAQATAEISRLEAAQSNLQTRGADLENAVKAKDSELGKVQEDFSRTRCALAMSRSAIEAFDQKAYESANNLYSEALACDPDNAYLLALKAYSLFKVGKIDEAISMERRSVSTDPNYGWGYFDLARFLCAAGPKQFPEARVAINKAIQLRPGLEHIIRGDGEFKRLCKGLFP